MSNFAEERRGSEYVFFSSLAIYFLHYHTLFLTLVRGQYGPMFVFFSVAVRLYFHSDREKGKEHNRENEKNIKKRKNFERQRRERENKR
jgi:hypothetical protein